MRVAMFKKASDSVTKCIVFFVGVSVIFRQKLMLIRTKSSKYDIAREHRQGIRVWNAILQQLIDFRSIFRIPLAAWGPPRTSQERPRSLQCSHRLSLAVQNQPGPATEKPQAGPGRAPGISRAPFCVAFGSFWESIYVQPGRHGRGSDDRPLGPAECAERSN